MVGFTYAWSNRLLGAFSDANLATSSVSSLHIYSRTVKIVNIVSTSIG